MKIKDMIKLLKSVDLDCDMEFHLQTPVGLLPLEVAGLADTEDPNRVSLYFIEEAEYDFNDFSDNNGGLDS